MSSEKGIEDETVDWTSLNKNEEISSRVKEQSYKSGLKYSWHWLPFFMALPFLP